ncbi:MotA/TolQ/ExbB proton channel family protein [Acidobacteriota bacterium]
MIEFLKSGGLVMIPLGLCSLIALAITVERLFNLRPSKILNRSMMKPVIELAKAGKKEEAKELLQDNPGILSTILLSALDNAGSDPEDLRQTVLDTGRQQVPKLERYLPALATIAGIAPLLGLLGTVTGMIKVFNVVAAEEAGLTTGLASGISIALITTATGLTLAIPTLVIHQFLYARADRILLGLERIAFAFLKELLKISEKPEKDEDAFRVEPGRVLRAKVREKR